MLMELLSELKHFEDTDWLPIYSIHNRMIELIWWNILLFGATSFSKKFYKEKYLLNFIFTTKKSDDQIPSD